MLSQCWFNVVDDGPTLSQHWENIYEINGVLGHLCAHIGYTGPGQHREDGEMNEITLPSRHRIRNSSPGGLRSSTLPLGHGGIPQYFET